MKIKAEMIFTIFNLQIPVDRLRENFSFFNFFGLYLLLLLVLQKRLKKYEKFITIYKKSKERRKFCNIVNETGLN